MRMQFTSGEVTTRRGFVSHFPCQLIVEVERSSDVKKRKVGESVETNARCQGSSPATRVKRQ